MQCKQHHCSSGQLYSTAGLSHTLFQSHLQKHNSADVCANNIIGITKYIICNSNSKKTKSTKKRLKLYEISIITLRIILLLKDNLFNLKSVITCMHTDSVEGSHLLKYCSVHVVIQIYSKSHYRISYTIYPATNNM